MLEDPARVADRLAAEDEHRHYGLARERVDLVALSAPPRHAPLLELVAVRAQRPRDPSARAKPVRGRSAAVEHDHAPIIALGFRAMGQVAVVTDSTHYMPREVT